MVGVGGGRDPLWGQGRSSGQGQIYSFERQRNYSLQVEELAWEVFGGEAYPQGRRLPAALLCSAFEVPPVSSGQPHQCPQFPFQQQKSAFVKSGARRRFKYITCFTLIKY